MYGFDVLMPKASEEMANHLSISPGTPVASSGDSHSPSPSTQSADDVNTL